MGNININRRDFIKTISATIDARSIPRISCNPVKVLKTNLSTAGFTGIESPWDRIIDGKDISNLLKDPL